ncbi:ATP-binding cassette domain-containing protein [Nocardia wallacei]|uniref:ATP-binding cassette domain-containing protein n=1 Tax=Nocardia wallacei TaxID=480035 RepID=UPI0024568E69|nr:ATP-binding cassette domain-containing protein [Nocardia wallacei]
MIVVRELSVSAASAPLLDTISLRVPEGGVTALRGPSGCGKSTLMKALLGQVPAGTTASGVVHVGEHEVLTLEPLALRRFRREQIAFVGQDPGVALNPTMRVRSLLGELSDPATALESLAAVELPESYLRRRPAELSGGEQRRVALARALARRTPVLVLDEPLAGLHGRLRTSVIHLLRSLADDHGTTIVVSGHDTAALHDLADEVVTVGNGRNVMSGKVVDPSRDSSVGLGSADEALTVGSGRNVMSGKAVDSSRDSSVGQGSADKVIAVGSGRNVMSGKAVDSSRDSSVGQGSAGEVTAVGNGRSAMSGKVVDPGRDSSVEHSSADEVTAIDSGRNAIDGEAVDLRHDMPVEHGSADEVITVGNGRSAVSGEAVDSSRDALVGQGSADEAIVVGDGRGAVSGKAVDPGRDVSVGQGSADEVVAVGGGRGAVGSEAVDPGRDASVGQGLVDEVVATGDGRGAVRGKAVDSAGDSSIDFAVEESVTSDVAGRSCPGEAVVGPERPGGVGVSATDSVVGGALPGDGVHRPVDAVGAGVKPDRHAAGVPVGSGGTVGGAGESSGGTKGIGAQVLSASGLGVSIGRRMVLENVDLGLAAGESVAVAGPSGAGKSTLARAVVGLRRAAVGEVRVSGRVALVPQDSAGSLNPRRTVAQTLSRPVRRHGGVRGPEVMAEVARLLDTVELESALAQRYPHELSGGQRQRVALARALALRPAVLVCDEITSALDRGTADAIMTLLDSLRRDRNLALLVITHDMHVVSRYCTGMCVLESGRIVETGPVAKVLAAPAHDATAALLG